MYLSPWWVAHPPTIARNDKSVKTFNQGLWLTNLGTKILNSEPDCRQAGFQLVTFNLELEFNNTLKITNI
jgi:hypothetical protein